MHQHRGAEVAGAHRGRQARAAAADDDDIDLVVPMAVVAHVARRGFGRCREPEAGDADRRRRAFGEEVAARGVIDVIVRRRRLGFFDLLMCAILRNGMTRRAAVRGARS